MKINGKLFDYALMVCANDDDKDYTETISMYRDFKNKNYKYNCLTRALQLQFLTENWGKLTEKCPRLMHNYYLLVDLWLQPKYSDFIVKLTKGRTPIFVDFKEEQKENLIDAIVKDYLEKLDSIF